MQRLATEKHSFPFSPLIIILRMEEKTVRLQAEAWVLYMVLQQKLLYEMRPPAACLRACFLSPLGQAAQAWPACACLAMRWTSKVL